jgi:hypothetical protein
MFFPYRLLGNVSVKIPQSLLGNGSVKTLPINEYTCNIRRIVGRIAFYAVRVVSEENRLLVFSELPVYFASAEKEVSYAPTVKPSRLTTHKFSSRLRSLDLLSVLLFSNGQRSNRTCHETCAPQKLHGKTNFRLIPLFAVIINPFLPTQALKINVSSFSPQRHVFSFSNSKSTYEYENKTRPIFHFYKDSCSIFVVVTAMTIESTAFWFLTSCNLMKVYRRFGGTEFLTLHSRSATQGISKAV